MRSNQWLAATTVCILLLLAGGNVVRMLKKGAHAKGGQAGPGEPGGGLEVVERAKSSREPSTSSGFAALSPELQELVLEIDDQIDALGEEHYFTDVERIRRALWPQVQKLTL